MMMPRCAPCCGAAWRGKVFVVSEAKDGREIQARRNLQPVSLITLDLISGGENGWIWLATFARTAAFRSLCRPVRVILSTGLLTSRWAPTTTLVKSFQLCELLSRIRAVVRGSRHPGEKRMAGR